MSKPNVKRETSNVKRENFLNADVKQRSCGEGFCSAQDVKTSGAK